MIAQRPPGAAPAVRAVAEQLPIQTNAVDAALAVLTIHHWTDLDRGIAEMIRIARRRVVILTWDHTVFGQFWLLREHLPAAAETAAYLAIPLTRVAELLGNPAILPIPIPHDCTDGSGGAYWRRPHAYLNPTVQAGMSMLALTPEALLHDGLSRLRTDLAGGQWNSRHADLLTKQHIGTSTSDTGSSSQTLPTTDPQPRL
jgi:SAM-dependent methyltransferase